MKRISNNRDLFEAPRNEVITITVEASKVPFQATFSKLESGGQWTQVQAPTLQAPAEIRKFTMPTGSREFFVISYGFPPAGQTDAAAKYKTTISGGGTTDGPNDIDPPASGVSEDLSYQFNLAAGIERISSKRPVKVVVKKAAANNTHAKKAIGKVPKAKETAIKKTSAKKTAAPKTASKKGPRRGGRR